MRSPKAPCRRAVILDVYKRQGYDRWAAVHNLKQMAATVAAYGQYGYSPEELDEMCIRDRHLLP